MFTGIVEGQGEVADLALGPGGARLRVRAPWLDGLRLGDSVSVNGCCLTVTDLEPDGFTADVMAESLRRTALGRLGRGDQLNLERPLQVGDRLGGHMVQGHVDGLGRVLERRRLGEGPGDAFAHRDGAQALLGGRRRGPGNPKGVPRWIGGSELPPHGQRTDVPEAAAPRVSDELRIGLDPELARYVVAKGSITVNGVSLTVVEAGPDWLTVALIPHTMAVTNLGRLAAGDEVQLEVDVLAKYVERLLAPRLATGERGRA
jgi:riboflavin synthase